MGIAAAEFYSANDGAKQTLSRRITPSDKQMDQQRERWDLLAQHLLSDLGSRSGLTMRHWLQGSYKFGTQVRPMRMAEEFDIDHGIYFEWPGSAEQGRLSPQQLKAFVQDSLNQYCKAHSQEVLEVTLKNAAQLPVGAIVNWTVRNEGEEAEEMNDLGHKGGNGVSRKEKSAYVGRHFMDCVVKLRGQVIAIRRVPVIVQGVPVAPRNLPRRTTRWT